MPLSDTRIRNAKAKANPYKLTDGKGLYLEVRPTGAKLWRYRYKLKDDTGKFKEYLYALGEYVKAPEVESPEQASTRRSAGQFTLEEARIERLRLRGLVRQGIHPITQKRAHIASTRADASNTFQALGREWLAEMKPHWSAGYYHQVETALEGDVFPEVGALPIRQVSARMIGSIMETVAKRGAPVIAINIRQWVSAVFAHAVRKDAADGDPTAILRGRVKRKPVKHKTPLTEAQIPEMVQRVKQSASFPQTKIALKLLLRLFVRPTELRKGEWTEFDLDKAEWVVPAARMKKRDHLVVPLPWQAVDDLRELQGLTGKGRWLFPKLGEGKKKPGSAKLPNPCMSPGTLNKALGTIGYRGKFSPHAYRATASTILHGMGFDHDIIEFQLAHQERDETSASYNQYQWIKERRALMQQWSDAIDSWIAEGADKVSPIKRRAA